MSSRPRPPRRPSSADAPQPAPRGARTQRVSLENRYQAWRRHHRQVGAESLQRMRAHPIASVLTMLAIAVSFVLPAMLWLAMSSVNALDGRLDDGSQMTLYMKPGSDNSVVERTASQVSQTDGVAKVSVITADEGLKEFQQTLGLSLSPGQLRDNPLPAALIISPSLRDTADVQALSERLKMLPGVDEVRMDLAWLQRLKAVKGLGNRLVLALGVLFGFGVILIVGNTVRLSVESRRHEIEVITLLGATQGFVRRPFLYTGALYGAGGGVLALLLLTLGRGWLSAPIRALAESYGSQYTLPGPGLSGSLLLFACSILLGLLGAWVAVSHHWARIRPR